MSTACGRPQEGGSGSCGRMWTWGRGSKVRFFLDVINGWRLISLLIEKAPIDQWCCIRCTIPTCMSVKSLEELSDWLLIFVSIVIRNLRRRCRLVNGLQTFRRWCHSLPLWIMWRQFARACSTSQQDMLTIMTTMIKMMSCYRLWRVCCCCFWSCCNWSLNWWCNNEQE